MPRLPRLPGLPQSYKFQELITRPGRTVFDHIRGCDPQPGASALLRDAPVRLFDTKLRLAAPEAAPGTVIAEDDGKLDIAVIGGVLTVGRLQAEGARKVAAAELAGVGEILLRDDATLRDAAGS